MKERGPYRQMVEQVLNISRLTGFPLDVVADVIDAMAEVNSWDEEEEPASTQEVLAAWCRGDGLTKH